MRAASGIAGVALLLACAGEPAAGPNLLLVTVDTLRPDRLACYGGPPDVGTAICAPGARGVRYLWAFSPAPSTAPAIASILTSRYPSFHGVSQFAHTRLPDAARSVAEELAAAGYATGAVISNPVLGSARRLDQGFEAYDARMDRPEGNRRDFRERDARSATDAALGWLDESPEPWFLWVHYQDPHGPYAPPGAPPARDAAGVHSLPALRDHSGRGGLPAYQQQGAARGIETYEARYLDEIRYLDGELARLLARAGAAARPTGVLLTADHGEAFGEDDYWFAHGHSVGLDQIRVPLLWQPPGGAAPALVRAPVSTLDVAPTLLAAAGLPLPEAFQGRPLPPGEPADAAPRPLYAEHRLRAAVLLGPHYFARDRPALDRPVRDRISGGFLLPLPARAARLDPTGAPGAYSEPAADPAAAALAPVLDAFLRDAGARSEPAAATPDPATQRALEALGYLE